MIRYILVAAVIAVASVLQAQKLAGTVKDAISAEPLAGANVILDDSVAFAVTNPSGEYFFETVAPGRHTLTVSFIGYKRAVIHDVWIRNGKTITENIELTPDPTSLSEVVITEPKRLNEIGKMTISEEQINRFAATYYDPARLVTISPDVAVSNDQNNRISVRGISPNYNTWRLEDVEIVNPNHLSNAGTFSDQPTSTGGGVNILSAQMLERSSFMYSGFSAEYGNSVGGLFDMHLKSGNKDKRQYTAQASLIGFDFSAEGPFSAKGDASYIVNYRYSFTGLLTSMGVDFGGESIGFQDLSFNVKKPLGDKGSLSFFGVGGLNFNNFDAKPLAESEFLKDQSDISFDGKMGVVGSKLSLMLGNGIFKISGAYSKNKNERSQTTYFSPQGLLQPNFEDNSSSSRRSILSTNSSYEFKIWNSQVILGGLVNFYGNEFAYSYGEVFLISSSTKYNARLYCPYVNFQIPFSQKLKFEAGLNYNIGQWDIKRRNLPQHNGFIVELLDKSYSSTSVDPRVKLYINSSAHTDIYLTFGRYSQILDHTNYYFLYNNNGGDYVEINRKYALQQSYRYIVGFDRQHDYWKVTTELFFYDFPEVYIGDFSWLNYAETPTVSDLEISSAKSYGISTMGNRAFVKGWYCNVGASAFNSSWGDNNPNRFNIIYSFNMAGGKEWDYKKKDIDKSLNINLNGIVQGGMKEPSELGDLKIVRTDNSIFYRIDLRIQLTKHLENKTTTISLDLQNATLRKNDAYQFNDPLRREFIEVKQLGLIPILTYRMEF